MEKPWLKNYPANIPAEIDVSRYNSLIELINESSKNFAERSAYHLMGKTLSFAEIDSLSLRFASALQSLGVTPGTRLAIMLPNVLQTPVCLFGALRAGCVIVNCNPLYTATELIHQLSDSGTEVIVVAENFAATVAKALPKTQIKHVIVTEIGDLIGGIRGVIINAIVRYVKKAIPTWHIPSAIQLKSFLKNSDSNKFIPISRTRDDIAFLQYTGGTTGVSKGAMLTHGNLIANVLQAEAWISKTITRPNELVLTALPLYHIFALTANCFTFYKLGIANLLIANARDIPGLIKAMRRQPPSVITGVNTLFNALLQNPEFAQLDFSHLKFTLGGGMAVQKVVAERWKKVTGQALTQAYGLTETSPAVTMNPLQLQEFNGSIGLPISSTEVSIRNDKGETVAMGESGEICVKGPQVMLGYWQRPEETKAVFFPDGWLRTGDIGTIDENGFVYVVDRLKDMVLVSGFNVFPNEVEAVLVQHPDVVEAAVIGVPDAKSGEAVKAFIISKSKSLTKEEVIKHCRQYLTAYKIPHLIEFRADLPRTNVGKILRRALKDQSI